MTREEELDWLCRLKSGIYVYMPKEWAIPMNNVLDMVIKDLEQTPCDDWCDVPSDEMTLEQARQAVRDLRKKLMEHLEQESVLNKINKMKSEIADSLEFWDYSPNNNPLARDILETLTNFFGDMREVEE